MRSPLLLGLAGSLRRASTNAILLQSLAADLAGRIELAVHPLTGLPLYNQDLESAGLPADVTALWRAIRDADALVIASPEFNHGMPGVLKNALDWASRPHGASPLIGKPVLVITSSPGALGGVRAHAQLNDTLLATGSRLLAGPQAVVPFVREKILDGHVNDEATLTFLRSAVGRLIEIIGSASDSQFGRPLKLRESESRLGKI